MAREPYCRNCGYLLVGLTESSKCPECGRPIVEVLERDRALPRGRRYKSGVVLFGLPLVHVAIGPHEDELYGRARGIFAVGDIATGWFACGGLAAGLIACGGLAIGAFTLGGLAIGLLALGGGALGGAVAGGGAVGAIAQGGGAVGYIAEGGGAAGYYARGGAAYARYAVDWRRRDPEAVALFQRWSWLLGAPPGPGSANPLALLRFTFPLWIVLGGMLFASLCGLIVWQAYRRHRAEAEYR